MKRRLLYFSCLLGMFLLYTAHSGGPQTGKTGAPGESLCTQCHSPGNPQGLNGTVSISGLPATITGGNTYPITITVTNPNMLSQGAGFQMTALNQFNQAAGNFTGPSSGSRVHSGGGRQYHDHTSRRPYSGGAATWSVNWTAPMYAMDTDVTLYAAGNITDMQSGFNTANDLIVTTNVSGTVLASLVPVSVSIIGSTNVTCFGGSDGTATASAMDGTPPYNYNWSNGQTGSMLSNVPAGTYTVTVTDNMGDMDTDQVTISQPGSPTNIILISKTDVSCFNGNDGSLQVQATGNNGGFTFQWSNGQSGPFISNLTANTYTVTATDSRGCQDETDFEITEPNEIEYSVMVTNASCGDLNSGSALIEVTGGIPPYNFTWSNGFMETGISTEQTGLMPGPYSIQIKDANDCIANAVLTVALEAGISINLTDLGDITCPGENDGFISTSISGGTTPYDITWSNGASTSSISDLGPGDYTIVVEDDEGCVDSATYTITEPDPVVLELLSGTSTSCADDTVEVIFTYSGGAWNGPSGDTVTEFRLPGTYSYTVVDANNCVYELNYDVEHNDTEAPTIDCIGDTTTSSCTFSYPMPLLTDNCDSVRLNVVEGLGPNTVFPAGLTTVTLMATDAAGNSSTCSFVVNVLNDLTLSSFVLEEALCAGDTSVYAVSGSGGKGDLSVVINGDTIGLSGDSIEIKLDTVTTIELLDTTGCFDQLTLGPRLTPVQIDSSEVVQMTSQGADDGEIEIFVSGGVGNYNYLWLNTVGDTLGSSSTIGGLAPGDYFCIAADSNGCEVLSDTFTLDLITATRRDIDQNSVEIYPNPFSESITVEVTGNLVIGMEILTSKGQNVLHLDRPLDMSAIDLTSLDQGVYYVVIYTNDGVCTRKIIKM